MRPRGGTGARVRGNGLSQPSSRKLPAVLAWSWEAQAVKRGVVRGRPRGEGREAAAAVVGIWKVQACGGPCAARLLAGARLLAALSMHTGPLPSNPRKIPPGTCRLSGRSQWYRVTTGMILFAISLWVYAVVIAMCDLSLLPTRLGFCNATHAPAALIRAGRWPAFSLVLPGAQPAQ